MDYTRRDITKAYKKIRRCIGILQRDLPDILVSDIPTKHIFIGNAGLTTNADESSLVELITSVGSGLEALTLLPGRQYSFASFSSPCQAQAVLMAAHGRLDIPGSASPVYMAYVDQVPVDPSPIKFKFPPGLMLLEEFISPEEEVELMNYIDWGDNPASVAEGSVLKHRQVRHFGYEFNYSTNSVDKNYPLLQGIPSVFSSIVQRIVEQGCMTVAPDQLTVNRYLPGHGIPPHVDTHSSFTDEILSLSVGGGVNMDFRYASGWTEGLQEKPCHYVVYLPPRSLCVMTGQARYEWSHGICPRMTDVVPSKNGSTGLQLMVRQERVSFTFRKVRKGECHCGNARVCDSFSNKENCVSTKDEANSGSLPSVLDIDKTAAKLEKEHVLQVYDQIASHFSVTRHKPWPKVLEFVCSLPVGSTLLDVGCGNGKYMGHNKQVFQVGCDTSFELMKICNSRGFQVMTSNCLQLPYRDCVFDAVVCIAVIHHLATEERRFGAIAEIVRVLTVGGHGLIYVWAMEQQRGKKKSTYLKQNKANRYDEHQEELLINDGEKFKDSEQISERKIYFDGQCQEGSRDYLETSSGAVSLPVHINRTEFVQQDMLVPWKLKPQKKKEALCERRGKHKKESGSCCRCRCIRHHVSKSAGDALNAEHRDGNVAVLDDNRKETLQHKSKTESSPDQVFHRFYHVFKQGELDGLCEGLGVEVIKSYYDEGNWCIVFQKVS